METKLKIIKIINEEINKFREETDYYFKEGKFKDVKIALKALKRLEKMIMRIQEEA